MEFLKHTISINTPLLKQDETRLIAAKQIMNAYNQTLKDYSEEDIIHNLSKPDNMALLVAKLMINTIIPYSEALYSNRKKELRKYNYLIINLKRAIAICESQCRENRNNIPLARAIFHAYQKALEHFTDDEIKDRLNSAENERLEKTKLFIHGLETKNEDEQLCITALLWAL